MDIKKLKQLREITGAGMLESKKALEMTNDNLEEAIQYVKEHTKYESNNQRVASKGLTRVVIHQDDAILYEVNAETDFAAKHPLFLDLLDQLSKRFIESKANILKDALALNIENQSVKDYITYVGGLMKENIYLRRFHRIKKQPDQGFGHYMHQMGKLSVLVILNQDHESLGKEIAMTIAAMSPSYIRLEKIDQDTINYEKFLYEKDTLGYPTFESFLEEKILHELPFNPYGGKKVKEVLLDAKIEVIDFYRFELGQGIEDKLNCRLDIPCDGSKITVVPVY